MPPNIDDGVLSQLAFEKLSAGIYGNIPFLMAPIVARNTTDTNEKLKDNVQFSHFFYLNNQPQGEHLHLLKDLIEHIKPLAIIRIRLNITLPTKEIVRHDLHWDASESVYNKMVAKPYVGLTNSIFYLNTCNGYTFFEDGETVPSVANRLLTFDNTHKHSGTTCTDAAFRAVLNFCYVQAQTGP